MLQKALARPAPNLFPEILLAIKRTDGETDDEAYLRIGRDLRYLGVDAWESWASKAAYGPKSSYNIEFQDRYKRWLSLVLELHDNQPARNIFVRYEQRGGYAQALLDALWSIRNREGRPVREAQPRTVKAKIRWFKEATRAVLHLPIEDRQLREALYFALERATSYPESASEHSDLLHKLTGRRGRPAGLNRHNFMIGLIALEFRRCFGHPCYKDILTLLKLGDPTYSAKVENEEDPNKILDPIDAIRKRVAFVNQRHGRELRRWHRHLFLDRHPEKNPS